MGTLEAGGARAACLEELAQGSLEVGVLGERFGGRGGEAVGQVGDDDVAGLEGGVVGGAAEGGLGMPVGGVGGVEAEEGDGARGEGVGVFGQQGGGGVCR